MKKRINQLLSGVFSLVFSVVFLGSDAAFAKAATPFRYHAFANVRFSDTSTPNTFSRYDVTANATSFLDDGGALGLRYGSGREFNLANLGFSGRYQAKGKQFRLDVFVQPEKSDPAVTQAFVHFRPAPKSPWRKELKVGIFYAPFSVENHGPAWTSPHTSNFSAINSWQAEELRTIGAEVKLSRAFNWHGLRFNWNAFGALFAFNDTTGALLAWRGWSNHDLQVGIGQTLELPQFPQRQRGGVFEEQEAFTEPFNEIDNRLGFYAGSELALRKHFRLQYAFYDNQGKPSELKGGQYAWRTKFSHVGLRYTPFKKTRVLAQYISGSSQMGLLQSYINIDFESFFLLYSVDWNKNRLALRWERFFIEDNDSTLLDFNDEHGKAITLSYSRKLKKSLAVSLEVTRWESFRIGRNFIPLQQADVAVNQLLVNVKYQF